MAKGFYHQPLHRSVQLEDWPGHKGALYGLLLMPEFVDVDPQLRLMYYLPSARTSEWSRQSLRHWTIYI